MRRGRDSRSDTTDDDGNMGKVATRLRSVTYTLSPMRTGVMHGLFKDWAAGMAKRVKENVVDAGLFCAVPLIGTMAYVMRRATRRDSTTTTVTRGLFVCDGWMNRAIGDVIRAGNKQRLMDGKTDRARVSNEETRLERRRLTNQL